MDHLIINKIIQDLERGKSSVHQMRDLLNERRGSINDDHDQDYYKGLVGHSMVALTALDSALSMLHNNSHHLSNLEDNNVKSQDFVQQTLKKDRRGCYKRRRCVESMIMDTTNLTDDGFAWRKYGQKVILHAKHPRNYYRCTHKMDQGCQATKQVQQISENPTKHRVIYHGNHTCKLNLLKTPNIFLNSNTSPPENQDSSVYLNFETNTNTPSAKHTLITTFSLSNSSSGSAMVKQEHGPIKEETQSEPSDLHHHNEYNSSPSSPDPTATNTPRSEISSVDQVYSSVASPHGMDMEEDYYSHMMMADSIDLDFLQNLLNSDA